jgi:hypothetical protein
MKISDLSVAEIKKCYDDPNLQESVSQFVGLLKRFDVTEDDKYLEDMTDIALATVPKLPFDEVMMDDEWTTNPNTIMLVVGAYMVKSGILPSY